MMPDGRVVGNWHATAAQRAYYREDHYLCIPEIIAKVLVVHGAGA